MGLPPFIGIMNGLHTYIRLQPALVAPNERVDSVQHPFVPPGQKGENQETPFSRASWRNSRENGVFLFLLQVRSSGPALIANEVRQNGDIDQFALVRFICPVKLEKEANRPDAQPDYEGARDGDDDVKNNSPGQRLCVVGTDISAVLLIFQQEDNDGDQRGKNI